jgi:hypothetical protein
MRTSRTSNVQPTLCFSPLSLHRLSRSQSCLCVPANFYMPETIFMELVFIYGLSLGSRDSSVGIETDYGLDDRGVGVRVPAGSRIFHVVRTATGVHQASFPKGTVNSLPRLKRPGLRTDHSASASDEMKKPWIYTSTSLYAFMAVFN